MAKTRVIDTRFWIDDYISHLDPIEKMMFLYFLTNPFTDISGIYEIPLKNISLDTGIEKEMVEKILKRFERDNKIYFMNGWVAIKNFTRYQNTNNPKIARGIEIGLSKAPKEIIDKLSISNQDLSHPNSNSNSNSKIDNSPSQINRKFFERQGEYNNLLNLYSKNRDLDNTKKEFTKFILYWTEPNKSGTKVKWEQQSTFDVKRRLITWFSKDWNNKK